MKLSRSNKSKQKSEFLNILQNKAFSENWEERYISIYAVSRFWWRSGKFEDFQKAYSNVLRLLEDETARRIASVKLTENIYSIPKNFNKNDY